MHWHHEHSFGWGTLALVTAILAQSKGRSALAWFILSLFIGPLALLLLLVVGRHPRHRYFNDPNGTYR